MNTLKAQILWFMSMALVLCLGASCSSLQKTTTPPPLVDLSSRRLVGRQTLTIEKGLVLHADRIAPRPDGLIEASGSVYLDGHRYSSSEPSSWPMHAYSDSAEWKAVARSLTLTGSPVLECRRFRITSTSTECCITLKENSMKSVGPTITQMILDPKPSTQLIEK